MTEPRVTNMAASVHQRLLTISHKRKEEFNLLLTRYAHERLLYRLVQARYGEEFVLKGARLLALWGERLHRPTHDLDLLGFGASTPEAIASVFEGVCTVSVEADGLVFDPRSVRVNAIREEQIYGGQRVQLIAQLGPAQIPLQVDIGFGDTVFPRPRQAAYPALLDFPAPLLYVYPKEAVVAEKLHAMVELDMLNSRMKDFYDLWAMSRELTFDGPVLAQAIRSSFDGRKTVIPQTRPVALTPEFGQSPDKLKQWSAFLKRTRIGVPTQSLFEIVSQLDVFLTPVLRALGTGDVLDLTWPPGGPWSERMSDANA